MQGVGVIRQGHGPGFGRVIKREDVRGMVFAVSTVLYIVHVIHANHYHV
jgi:hypothetical protein